MGCRLCERERAMKENPNGIFALDALMHTCDQPERSKREDLAYCIVCETNSRVPENGAGHWCKKCKEYDYA
jgi:hypothetical protein